MNSNLIYAGFWKRFVAYLLDQLILGFARGILFTAFWVFFLVNFFYNNDQQEIFKYSYVSGQHFNSEFSFEVLSTLFLAILFFSLINIIIEWLYFALMESSSKQATLGKIIMSIRVTDLNHQRISFGKASGRYFGKIISGLILCVGYIMAGFTEKKQALHDIMANCLVVDSVPFMYTEMQKQN